MQAQPGSPPQDGSGRVTGEFLIPDLCSSRAVFIMVLLAELLVVLHTLANSQLPNLNWDLMGSSSLFVQWVVLGSAALLCPLRKAFARMSLPVASACSLLLVMLVAALSSLAGEFRQTGIIGVVWK